MILVPSWFAMCAPGPSRAQSVRPRECPCIPAAPPATRTACGSQLDFDRMCESSVVFSRQQQQLQDLSISQSNLQVEVTTVREPTIAMQSSLKRIEAALTNSSGASSRGGTSFGGSPRDPFRVSSGEPRPTRRNTYETGVVSGSVGVRSV